MLDKLPKFLDYIHNEWEWQEKANFVLPHHLLRIFQISVSLFSIKDKEADKHIDCGIYWIGTHKIFQCICKYGWFY